jgi:hypothetical protein
MTLEHWSVRACSRTSHESPVNSAGLAPTGINAARPNPPGGAIVRDRHGRPTGVLIESARRWGGHKRSLGGLHGDCICPCNSKAPD